MTRLEKRLAALADRKAFAAFVMAGDPDQDTAAQILAGLPQAGVDIIELGMPFSDPMADGPAIQAAGTRALKASARLDDTLELTRKFRRNDDDTPLVAMGYYNPIHSYGAPRFIEAAAEAGIDGLIIVDLPPEEDGILRDPARAAGVHVIRLITPATGRERAEMICRDMSGFVYFVSVTGVTGTVAPEADKAGRDIEALKKLTPLPVLAGFGIRTAEQARAMAAVADGVVVGSAFADIIADTLDAEGRATTQTVPAVLTLASELAQGIR